MPSEPIITGITAADIAANSIKGTIHTPAIARHKYRWHRVDSGFIKLLIGDITIGTVRVKPPHHVQYGWHCTLPGIPSKAMYGIGGRMEDAQNALLDIVNAWFTVIDQ